MALREVVATWLVKSNAAQELHKIDKGLNDTEAGAKRSSRAVSGLNDELNSTSTRAPKVKGALEGLAAAGIAAGILHVGKAMIDTASKFETYNVVLKNTLGSQEKATEAMNMIENFASKTPYSVDEMTSSYIKFVNRGINPTIDQLTAFGDIAASQNKSFDQLTEAVLDAQSGEFERLKEFGIQASKQGSNISLAFKGVNKTIQNTPEAITQALESFGKMEGVTGLMDQISDTWQGTTSNMGDNIDKFNKIFGGALIDLIRRPVKYFSKGIEKMNSYFSDTEHGAQRVKIAMTGIGVVVGSVLVAALYSAAVAAWSLITPLLPIVGVVLAIGAGMAALVIAVEDFLTWLDGGESIIGEFLDPFLEKVKYAINLTSDLYNKFLNFVGLGSDKEIKVTQTQSSLAGRRVGGGPVTEGSEYFVGEDGPEKFTPTKSGHITPNKSIGKAIQLTFGDIIINVKDSTTIAEDIVRQVKIAMDKLATFDLREEAGI